MALTSPPSFDALERLSRTRDADLIHSRQWVDPDRVRGRDLWEDLQAWRSRPWLWAGGVLATVGWIYKIWLVRAS